MNKIRVLIVDDHAVLRAGLHVLLEEQPDIEVVGEAANGRDAVELVTQTQPNVVLLDLEMPGGGGLEALARIREGQSGTRVLVLTMHDDAASVRRVLAAGADGFVTKSSAGAELLTAVRTVHTGRSYVGVALGQTGLGDGVTPAPQAPKSEAVLSKREQEVLVLVARGHANKEIAEKLDLSVKTVETYRARVGEKLGLRGRAELVRYAIEKGLLTSNE